MARQKTECPLLSTPQKHEGKAATKRSCRTLATAADVSKFTMPQVLTDELVVKPFKMKTLLTRAYDQLCGHEGQKNAEKSYRRWPAARCRISCSRTRRNSTSSRWQTSIMTELGFLVIHRGKNRHQTPNSAVCHGLGGRHRDREVSSAFCALCSQIELPALHRPHFGELSAALGQ